MVIFWVSYVLLVFSVVLWLLEHPLGLGGLVLFSYMFSSVVVSLSVSFVVGVFLFLTGVSGMMVAFLYVVALCPNPVFVLGKASKSGYSGWGVIMALVGFVLPSGVLIGSLFSSFSLEVSEAEEGFQWMRDPHMYGGLAELMPFLGLLLFLCMVSVVSLCGQQKQCLGGHGMNRSKRAYV